jgi:hypothetical protein
MDRDSDNSDFGTPQATGTTTSEYNSTQDQFSDAHTPTPRKKRMYISLLEKQRYISEYRSSGLSIRSFARGKSISEKNLRQWMKTVDDDLTYGKEQYSMHPGKKVPIHLLTISVILSCCHLKTF